MGDAPARIDTPSAVQVASADVRSMAFSLSLAAAALFHLAGNPRSAFAPSGIGVALVQLGVGALAVAVLVRPRSEPVRLALCVAIPVSAWSEAPTVGNHWVLAAFLSLGYLCAWAAGRRGGHDGSATFLTFLPSGRLILLVAYSFAAFAKLNSDFFDPLRSCAVFYQDQLVGSWGLGQLTVAGRSSLGLVVALAAAGIELSVPVLLALRRTRRVGVVVALSFHWLLALDLDQHFWDFSSVLFVGFLLFLDDGQVEALGGGARRLWAAVRRPVRLVGAATVAVAATVATGGAALADEAAIHGAAVATGHLAWLLAGTGLLVGVGLASARSSADPTRLTLPTSALWLVPLLVGLNGLTPYLEVKTGFGWQMYSNLRTVDGETNHLVLPATLDLTGLQRDRVEILGSSDPALAVLVGSRYEVVYSELREYARDRPDVEVTYLRDGVVHGPRLLGQDRAPGGIGGALSTHLQPFRVVDASGGERCLATFSPAR